MTGDMERHTRSIISLTSFLDLDLALDQTAYEHEKSLK
jgi:hypothetical protein